MTTDSGEPIICVFGYAEFSDVLWRLPVYREVLNGAGADGVGVKIRIFQ